MFVESAKEVLDWKCGFCGSKGEEEARCIHFGVGKQLKSRGSERRDVREEIFDSTKEERREGKQLLICHDFKGNYLSSDSSFFAETVEESLEMYYLSCSWRYCDIFIYFSHKTYFFPISNVLLT